MKKFELMALPYAPEALEPVISKQTLEFHYGKHLAGYVNNLNGLLEESPLAGLPLEEIVCKSTGGIQNNAGQILNHNLYFGQFAAPKADNRPVGKLAEAIPPQVVEQGVSSMKATGADVHPAVFMIAIGDEPSALDFPYYNDFIERLNR